MRSASRWRWPAAEPLASPPLCAAVTALRVPLAYARVRAGQPWSLPVSAADTRAGPRLRWASPQAIWRDSAARAALVLGAAGLGTIPLSGVTLPGGTAGEQIYASVLATGCGLAALLVFEEQLLGRPAPRQLGLCGTFLVLTAVAVSWATAYAPGVSRGAGFVDARLAWYLALSVGLALSLGTPSRLWGWIGQRLARNALSYALVAAGMGILVGLVAVPAATILTAPGAGGPAFGSGWLVLVLSATLLAVSVPRWAALTPTERWALAAGILGSVGLAMALAGGGHDALGGELGWLETAAGVGLVIGVVSSHMYSGEHQRLLQEIGERDLLRQLVADPLAAENPTQTGLRICRELVRLRGVAAAHVVALDAGGGAVPVASYPAPPEDYPAPVGHLLPEARSQDLRSRAAVGPWVEVIAAAARQALDPPMRDYWLTYSRLGIDAFAYAPIRHRGRAVGLLVVGVGGIGPEAASARLLELLPSLSDFAAVLGTTMAPLLDHPAGGGMLGLAVRRALDQGSFAPVFQPIVDLNTGEQAGYEALTRFSEGLPPDAAFRAAAQAGLEHELELATLHKALRQSGGLLSPGQFLSVNLSPEVLVAHAPELSGWFRDRRHPVVVEITEHSQVADYDELRRAASSLGPQVQLAVDDAGAGYSSLRHILELRPQFAKLDLSLVQGMVGDPAREALVAGMQHFAERSGFRLIAEGVETAEELSRLRSLGVELGQGYFLGRPLPLATSPARRGLDPALT